MLGKHELSPAIVRLLTVHARAAGCSALRADAMPLRFPDPCPMYELVSPNHVRSCRHSQRKPPTGIRPLEHAFSWVESRYKTSLYISRCNFHFIRPVARQRPHRGSRMILTGGCSLAGIIAIEMHRAGLYNEVTHLVERKCVTRRA